MRKSSRHWGDRVAELAGAIALGIGTAASTRQIAPLGGFEPALLAEAGGLAGLIAGWLIVRLTPGSSKPPALASFDVAPIESFIAKEFAPDELLLETQSTDPARDARLAALFGSPHPASPGDLQARIEMHLGDPSHASGGRVTSAPGHPQVIPDASDALHAALNEIRRSLRAH